MDFDSLPDVLNHFLLLSFKHPIIKVLRVLGGHEDDVIPLKVVFSKVDIVPYLDMPLTIETN